jgi:hypothetical protein
MRFLDQKEEVIKIKITPFGKYLISRGKFDPAYYAFFDDDIIYDSSYLSGTGNTGELQNSIEVRILDETPRFEGQTKFEGAEATVFSKFPEQLDESFPGISKKIADESYNIATVESPINQYYLQTPLGKSAYNSEKAPYFSLEALTGSFLTASISGESGSGYYNHHSGTIEFIPQVDLEVTNGIWLSKDADSFDPTANTPQDDEFFDSFYRFELDGSTLFYDKKRAFFKLEEGNTEFKKENFDIEVFEIITQKVKDPDDPDKEIPKSNLRKLSFAQEEDALNPSFVDYFFNLKLDNEIDDSYYCEVMKDKPNRIRNMFSDKTFRCPDEDEKLISVNIYNNSEIKDDD